jgi:uracil-DNA glycosylase
MFHSDINTFVSALAAYTPLTLFNPWGDVCDSDMPSNTPKAKQRRLVQHLSINSPQLILIGEAPGWQGCVHSGIPFTSESLLMDGAIPRLEATGRLTRRPRPFKEPSSTIVWRALYALGIAETTVLWNAVPYHPQGRSAQSNRTPTAAEVEAGLPWLEWLLNVYPDAKPVAVGGQAYGAMCCLDRTVERVRHPARGGARAFRDGVAACVAAR